MWLWWLCRNSQRVHRLRREKAKAEADWNMKLFQTSVMIQRIIRGRLSRLHVRRMRRDFTSAVMLMQKLLRGVRARRRVSRCSWELGSVRVLGLVFGLCVCVCVCVAVWLCVAVCGFGGVGVWGCDFVRAASNSARARRAYHYSPALPCVSQIRRFKEQAVPASQRIQHWWRQKLLLWAAQSELGARRHQAFVVQMSAIDIQRAARGFVARSVVKRRRRNFNFAATRIQARVRGNLQRAAYAPFKCKRLVRGAVCRVVDCGCSPAHKRVYRLAHVAVHLTARCDEDPVRQPHAPHQGHRGEASL